ncbi:type III secretion system domain-containing protein [Shewanella surugensis]|uniref:Uncharacterized protein n=1 Tax=Shewanella surugensis TaxID=212020 RepID=A0ABT0L7L0_9GAMM|nr:type III secretion system domain-containing protein [Shewanella surugensis]MCL1123677.1 hypothetical protein [Shewanella surugensis]
MLPEDKLLNQLMWQPCTRMHPSWWKQLDLERWQDLFYSSRLMSRRVNLLTISRLPAFDRGMHLKLTEQDKKLLTFGERLPVLLTGVGLVLLNSPDYITMRMYRDALFEVFTSEQIQQMLSLWPEGGDVGICTAENLMRAAQQLAIRELNNRWQDSQVWQALVPTLPCIQEGVLADVKAPIQDAERWLFRLERFI